MSTLLSTINYGKPLTFNDFPKGVTSCKCKDICTKLCTDNCDNIRKMLYNMHTAITELGYWNEFIINAPTDGGFMFSNNKWITDVCTHPLVEKDSHSGCSFAFGMRIMEYIAKNGWDAFVLGWSGNKQLV